ncbi:MAG: hypothetical protein LDL38_12985, partial [Flavobacterium piscis]|nr:hypothetical protein [Flavobacterium piscis]
ILALQKLLAKNKDALNNLEWYIPIVKNRQKNVNITTEILKSYEGKYGKAELKYENNNLYYNWNNIATLLLKPLEQDLFLLDGINDFRIKIVSENNVVTGIKRIYQDGQERFYKKE